jgi:hypothetical protein
LYPDCEFCTEAATNFVDKFFLREEVQRIGRGGIRRKEVPVELNGLPSANAAGLGGYSPAGPGFRYYIHDHSHVFRLELVGTISVTDVAELDGSWNTASRAIAERKVSIDLRKLTGMDDAARQWFSKMAQKPSLGFVAAADLVSELPEGCTVQIAAVEEVQAGRWQRFVRMLFPRRRGWSYNRPAAHVQAPFAIKRGESQIPAA